MQDQEAAFADIDNTQTVAEELGAIVSPDYTSRDLTPPGRKLSEHRVITLHSDFIVRLNAETMKAAGKTNPNQKAYLFQIDFKGLVDPTTGRKYLRPDRTWLSTAPRRKRIPGTKDYYPGVTSAVNDYLSATGFGASVLRAISGIDALKSALEDSAGRTVGVETGLGPKGKKTGVTKKNGKEFYRTPEQPSPGVYDNSKRLYTKAFLDPASNGEPRYLRAIEVDGETWEATETVERFFRPSAS